MATEVIKTSWVNKHGTGDGDWNDYPMCDCRYSIGAEMGRIYILPECDTHSLGQVDVPNLLDKLSANVPDVDPHPIETYNRESDRLGTDKYRLDTN